MSGAGTHVMSGVGDGTDSSTYGPTKQARDLTACWELTWRLQTRASAPAMEGTVGPVEKCAPAVPQPAAAFKWWRSGSTHIKVCIAAGNQFLTPSAHLLLCTVNKQQCCCQRAQPRNELKTSTSPPPLGGGGQQWFPSSDAGGPLHHYYARRASVCVISPIA